VVNVVDNPKPSSPAAVVGCRTRLVLIGQPDNNLRDVIISLLILSGKIVNDVTTSAP
jgi:hypothetical protein